MAAPRLLHQLPRKYLSVDGVEIFRNFLENDVRSYRGLVTHDKIVLNLLNGSYRRHKAYREKVRGLGYQVFEISQDAKLAEAQIYHQSITDYAPHSQVIPQLEALTEAILN